MTTRSFILKCTLALILSCLTLHVFAQSGKITGSVTDEKNQPIIGAIVRVYSTVVTKGGAATDVDGKYVVSPLAAGNDYEVKVDYVDYETAVFKGIVVRNGSSTKVNANLKLKTKQPREPVVTYQHEPLILIPPRPPVQDVNDIKRAGTTKPADPVAVTSPGILTQQKKVPPM